MHVKVVGYRNPDSADVYNYLGSLRNDLVHPVYPPTYGTRWFAAELLKTMHHFNCIDDLLAIASDNMHALDVHVSALSTLSHELRTGQEAIVQALRCRTA